MEPRVRRHTIAGFVGHPGSVPGIGEGFETVALTFDHGLIRTLCTGAALGTLGAIASGCVSSPTYGTDKSSTQQLVGDLSGILSLAPDKREAIDYKPRPELVRPQDGRPGALPSPQDSVAETPNSGWLESPEQRRARLRAEATENQDNPNYRSKIIPDMARAEARPDRRPSVSSTRNEESGISPTQDVVGQREEFKRRLAESRQGSATSRKYLSEPPLDYRAPAATAPTNDVGEDEYKKERRRKAEARKAAGTKSWADLWPF